MVSRLGGRRLGGSGLCKHSPFLASLASLPSELYPPTSPTGAELARRSGVLIIGAYSGYTGNSVHLGCVWRKRGNIEGLFRSIHLWHEVLFPLAIV
jgi:hypothetical protein